MRRIALVAAFLCTLAAPAAAGQMLYLAAADTNVVEGYCLGPNGGLTLTPKVTIGTVVQPRRLIVKDDVLYVAGASRVESFRIGPNGGLESLGKTPEMDGAKPLDITVDAGRTRLYVPRRAQGRIEAHPLDPATGGLTGAPFTSCALTSVNVLLEDLEAVGPPGAELLYVTESRSPYVGGKPGRIDIFPLVGGELPDVPTSFRCDPRVTTTTSTSTSSTTLTTTVTTSTTSTSIDDRITQPLSSRRKMKRPAPFVLHNDRIYVYDSHSRKILAFVLTNGLFSDEEEPRESTSNPAGLFFDLVRAGDTLIGPAFSQGRIRAFALKTDGGTTATLLPKAPQRTSEQIIESSPGRITVGEFCQCAAGDPACDPNDPPDPPCAGESKQVVYVSGGESFRVHAYRLVMASKGLLPETRPFSQSQRRQGVFPNDVAIARNVACP